MSLPPMSDNTWLSGRTPYSLGWISGLYTVANNSLSSIYGSYDEFKLNENSILNLDDLNADAFVQDSVGPIIYLSVWAAIAVIFTITGIVWCLCNKCICCCRSGLKKQDQDQSGSKGCRIFLPILMGILLLGFLLVILHCFGANEKTRETVKSIKPDLDAAINDATKYVNTVQKQLNFVFVDEYNTFQANVDDIVFSCGSVCSNPIFGSDTIKSKVNEAMDKTKTELDKSNTDLRSGINEVDQQIQDTKTKLDEDFEDAIDSANSGLYWGLMLFNVLYCVIFFLALLGTILAAFGVQRGMKLLGHLLLRVGIVLMFTTSIFVVAFMLVTFVAGGIASEIVCPAIRELENGDPPVISTTQQNPPYSMPTFPAILRACKADYSAYNAFNLQSAYDLSELATLEKEIDPIIEEIEKITPAPPELDEALATLKNIKIEINAYTSKATNLVKNEVGKCSPAYNLINATLDIFCYKIVAPVASYWWILQFVLPLYALMILTTILFERHNS